MAEKQSQFFDRCSFLTQVMFKGRGEDDSPIWRRPIAYDKDSWPVWDDWDDVKNKYIIPLCRVANGVTLFGVEWRSDRHELLELKKFIERLFAKQGRYLACNKPTELTDSSLFWAGGSSRHYSLIPVLSFSMEHLGFVIDTLRQHSQAGKMTLRSGGPWTSANNFAKSVVKEGGFAVISTGTKMEIYFPIEYKDQVEKVAQEVEVRREAESE